MNGRLFEIRECRNAQCRLRFPLVAEPPTGKRCPKCLGATRLVTRYRGIAHPHAASGRSKPPRQFEAILDNLRSAQNVGAIFRSADGFGLQHIYVSGFTPTPDLLEVRKTSLGAEKTVSWSQHNNGPELARQLKQSGRTIWALENRPDAVPIGKASPSPRPRCAAVLVVGNEVAGIDPGILHLADKILFIPMLGGKESFNVAIAFAIACYALTPAH